jgi:hypothetical protein
LGLQTLTTAQTGGSKGAIDVLVGAESVKPYASTSETTSANLPAYGVSIISSNNSTAVSTNPVYRMDPPIPGVRKTVVFTSTATGVASTVGYLLSLSTGASGAFLMGSTWSSSFTTLYTTNALVLDLVGITTNIWGTQISSGSVSLATTTT